MDFSKIISLTFGIAFMVILYFIIYYALKIMYKDLKVGVKRKPKSFIHDYGIEVLNSGENSNLEKESIFLLRDNITIGRKDTNIIILEDQFVSGNHALIKVKDNIVTIEDLDSTNGTFVNGKRLDESINLKANDKIKIGTAIFKLIKSEKS